MSERSEACTHLSTPNLILAIFVALTAGVQIAHGSEPNPPHDLSLDGVRGCDVYDAMLYTGKPSLDRYGLKPINIVYESWIWRHDDRMSRLPDREKVIAQVGRSSEKSLVLVLDIERWYVDDRADAQQFEDSLARLTEVSKWVRAEGPRVQFGYFGLVPEYNQRSSLLPETHPRRQEWDTTNRRLDRVARLVDIVFPELYPVSADVELWKESAIRHLAVAKTYERPVYAFIMPYFPETAAEKRFEPVAREFWREQLKTVCEHADAIVIWGGYQILWDDKAAWWQETRTFMKAKAH